MTPETFAEEILPHRLYETMSERADRLARQESALALKESELAEADEARASIGTDSNRALHRRAAEVHRTAESMHRSASALHKHHADHHRADPR